MPTKLTFSIILFFCVCKTFAQNERSLFRGKLKFNNNALPNVSILNKTSKIGTISDDLGFFSIEVVKNDTLIISSIQYEKKSILISEEMIKNGFYEIVLTPKTYELEEVFLHNLTENLSTDVKNIPKDTIPKINFRLTENDWNKINANFSSEESIEPNAQDMTDPIKMASGIGAGATIPDFKMQKIRKLKKQLNKQKEFPDKIKTTLGIDFFVVNLKIPEDKINEFLTFCEEKNIINLYYQDKLMDVIQILRDESKIYLEIKN